MLLYLAITAITLATLWVRKRYSYWKDRDVTFVPPTFPAGNIGGMGRKEHFSTLMDRCYRKLKGSGSFGGIFFFVSPVALALDLDFVKNILVKDFQYFLDRSVYHNEKDDPLSAHLFAMEGTKWKNLRAKLSPTFTSGKMKMMFPTITGVGEEFRKLVAQEITKEGEIEMKDILARFATDVIGCCAFGLECNSLQDPDAQFREMGKKATEPNPFRMIKLIVAQQFRTLAHALHVTTTNPDVANFFKGAVKDTVEYREKHKIERNDFMDLLIKLKNKDTLNEEDTSDLGALTLEEISAQAFAFFLAGFETSSTAMANCLYELALNQELQEKARNDVFESLKKHGSMTYEAVLDMHYVDNCISESLRKYPPAANLTRCVTKDYKVPNTNAVLEKGLTVVVSVYGIHHDPDYYPDPEKYDPDRFTPEEVAKRNPFCFIPFGEGPRICIGMRFGLMQARVGMAYMLSNFRFTLSSKTPVPLKIFSKGLFLTSEGGLWLHIERL